MLKHHLHNLCLNYIKERETQIKTTIAEARESAANETKSSAGDKYETAREMMQQEIDQSLARLAELDKLKATINHINPTLTGPTVLPGSVVCTSSGNYYISISAGRLYVDGNTYYAISAASPIGTQLMGHTAGHSFLLNGKTILIIEVI